MIQENERPQDLYTIILDQVKQNIAKGDTTQEHVREALRIVNRKLVKRTVMTIPYGVTKLGAFDQVLIEVNPLVRREHARPVSQLISMKTLATVDEVFGAAMELKGWLCKGMGSHFEAVGK